MDMGVYLQKILQKFEHLKIQLEEITSATNEFDDQNNRIGVGGFGKVYRGEVSHSKGRSMAGIKRLDSRGGQGVPEFLKEITMLSKYKHENLVSLLGFCYEGSEMILVYELASRGSLDRHLNSPHLSWTQRLKICLDTAKGLGYLHDPRETHQRLIHCDMKSANILLDDQWNAKISDFGLSIMGSANEQQSLIVTMAAGTRGYCDPQYAMTNTLTKESDVYSFGVVLFEVLTGRLCCTYSNGVIDKRFVPTWIESYKQKNLNDIVFKNPTIPPLDVSALKIFSDVAYRCLEEYREDRPNMAEVVAELETAVQRQSKFLQEFQHLRIFQLEEIKSATNNFNDQNYHIGVGGLGKVYKGELTHSKGRSMVAIKRLDLTHGQGIPEFWKEITMLSGYKHENLLSLLGFCCEGSEMILVYELASLGSLDGHLNSSSLSWTQRLKICLDAAKGLSYLHNPKGTIHRDVKSGNILLDDQLNAKVSNFGLSVMGSADEKHSVIDALVAGARGYCDPMYAMTHTLTKESDVYSFGVVLFEVLGGRLCCSYSTNGNVKKKFVPTWIKSYKPKNLNDIVFKSPSIIPLDQSALEIFSDIAYRCVEVHRGHRPRMAMVVEKLENALQRQERYYKEIVECAEPLLNYKEIVECVEEPLLNLSSFTYYKVIVESAEPLLNYRSDGELMQLLSKGVLLNKGKTWFSINKKGEHCEMRSFTDCVDEYDRYDFRHRSDLYAKRVRERSRYQSEYNNSRFVGGTYYLNYYRGVETRVETQFLSPGITYTVNLVFKYMLPMKKARQGHQYIELRYSLAGKQYNEPAYLAFERKDGWWMCELCQFTCDERKVDFFLQFNCRNDDKEFIEAEGIEFWPLEMVEHSDERQPILDLDVNWEETLPSDYEDLMKRSEDRVQWATEKEAYSLLRKGFLLEYGQKWFYLDKNGKKCHMLSADYVLKCVFNSMRSPESRFREVAEINNYVIKLKMRANIQSRLVSSDQTTYASYLVYKLPNHNPSKNKAPVLVKNKNKDSLSSEDASFWYIYLVSPQTPVLKPKTGQNTHNPPNRLNIKGLPRERHDGWMEVQIWKFQTPTANAPITMRLALKTCSWSDSNSFDGLIIEGIEFRPI